MTITRRVLWWLSISAALIVSTSITIPTVTAIAENRNHRKKNDLDQLENQK
jgi:hypothetical protein